MSYIGISHSIRCPQCNTNTEVLDSRPVRDKNGTRRRRGCLRCSHRFSTYEFIDNTEGLGMKELLEATIGMRIALHSLEMLTGISANKSKRKITREEVLSDLDSWRKIGDNPS